MPRVKCPLCQKAETILKAGFVRRRQRFFCKECRYHFTLIKERQLDRKKEKKRNVTTIMDIAKIIGVSVSTVSRALKDHPDISAGTKNTIKKIARELNYQPNTLAQSLTKQETRTIGVIVPNLETSFFTSILTGIQNKAFNAGYKVMISQSKESYLVETDHVQAFINNRVDGLFICHTKESKSFDHIKLCLHSGIPVVQFDRVCDDLNTSKVLLEDARGVYLVIKHLLQQGCTKVLFVSGPEHLNICRSRLSGYKKALKEFNIPFVSDLVIYTDLLLRSIVGAVEERVRIDKSVDAVFSISDIGAVHIISRLKEIGVKIPEQICVAGFGNDSIGAFIEPALTTFNPRTVEVGEKVAKLFFDQLKNDLPQTPKKIVVKGSLIIRSSSKRNN